MVESDNDAGQVLPPLAETLPVAENYFAHSNRLFPLFDQEPFMQRLRDWYMFPAKRDAGSWAAINVVLALGQRQCSLYGTRSQRVAAHVQAAQSVIDELVARDEDVLGVQVQLALCMLFQESSDPRPASILLATAVRSMQRLRMYSKQAHDYFGPAEVELRDRLFWIGYILDKDTSLRMQEPSLQADASNDIDLPPTEPADGCSGVITSRDGAARLGFFRCRVQLAILQGKVYDWLYSVSADRLTPAAREQHVATLEQMLDAWKRSIPREFRADAVPQTCQPGVVRYMAVLHCAHLHCLASINRANSHNPQWVQRVQRYSVLALADPSADAPQAPLPPLPGSWATMVRSARDCMKLLERVPGDDVSLIW